MKPIVMTLLTGAMLSVGALIAPALAADSGNTSAQKTQSSSQKEHRKPPYSGEFAGEVIAVRSATFANGKDYRLVKIRSKKGDVAVLNLGPVAHLQNNSKNLQEGAYISATGVSGRINGKPVLVVYRLSILGQNNGQNATQ